MNSRPRQKRRTFFTWIRVRDGQISVIRGLCVKVWRRSPRAGDVEASASTVSLLGVPAMAISFTTPGDGYGGT